MELPSAAEWTAFWTFCTLVVIAVSAVYARQQLHEARQLRIARSRPFVYVDLDFTAVKWLIDLVIVNSGPTLARDVQISFDPPPASTLREWGLPDSRMLTGGIPSLPPGKQIRFLFDNLHQRYDSNLPTEYRVEVCYHDGLGRDFKDVYVLDVGIYLGLEYLQEIGVHELGQTLEKIERTMNRWSSPTRGLEVGLQPEISRRMRGRNARIQGWRERADAGDRSAQAFFAIRGARRRVVDWWATVMETIFDLRRD